MSKAQKHYKHPAVVANNAHTDLVLFATIERIAETISSGSVADAMAIVARCQKAQQRCLHRLDAAMSKIADD